MFSFQFIQLLIHSHFINNFINFHSIHSLGPQCPSTLSLFLLSAH
eukprot:UN21788